MKLSYKWISEYVDLHDITPVQLADALTTAGLEVEGIETLANATNLVIGEVLECTDHPQSDHLHITKTDIGGQINQIICGAPNCRKGLKVIVALPGAKLPKAEIAVRTVLGVESQGMLCSLNEIGVNPKSLTPNQIEGIEELPEDAPVGEKNVLGYLGLDDAILDVSLTPNRADCYSLWNMAKEIGAILDRKVTLPDYQGKANVGKKTSFQVSSTTEGCQYFSAKVIQKVKVGPSIKWMKEYLLASGVSAINNVVDISNFVMLETGQPLHFYDLAKLENREITVVGDQELEMTALDGNQFKIEKGDILITTGGKPTGIAGVMGGEESMISDQTSGIVIEAAHFDGPSIRKTSNRLNLMTEAAQRFSKGVDLQAMEKAMDRAVMLLQQYADADDMEETVILKPVDKTPIVIEETLSHCNGLLGTAFTMEQVVDVLKRLDFDPKVDGDKITCTIPSYRRDITCKADIDEEIIRLIGFDTLETTLPKMESTSGQLSLEQSTRRLTATMMNAMGLSSIVTYTLVGQNYVDDALDACGDAIVLAMPMSEARKYVRNSLANSVLECVQYNQAHQNLQNNYFEISTVYAKGIEKERLAIVLSGTLGKDELHKKDGTVDFYTLKGILTTWLQKLGYTDSRIHINPNKKDDVHFHPYRSAELWIDNKYLGLFGQLHPEYAKKFDLKDIYYAEIGLDEIYDSKTSKVRFTPLDKYPSVQRDIALVVKQDISAEKIISVIKAANRNYIKNCEIFDVYTGEHVEKGYQSVAVHITYQSDHTLKDQEIQEVHQKVLDALNQKLGTQLRS